MESRIERLCRERGLKMTDQRRVVARVLSESSDHPDAEEVYRRAAVIDPKISLSTVYRTVRTFGEVGLLERRNFGGTRSRFESTDDENHYHLIDIANGKVIEFHDDDHDAMVRAIAERLGFELVSMRLELYGRKLSAGPANQRGRRGQARQGANGQRRSG